MISILISAYKTAPYIEECLDSIASQDYFKDGRHKYEILVGIDNDPDVDDKLYKIYKKYKNLRIFYMEKNVGTYVVFNTLLQYAKGDRILRFDSDDIAKPHLISSIIDFDEDVIQFKFENKYESGYLDDLPGTQIPDGVALINKSVFDKYGAYQDWRCAADTEFLTRLKGKISIRKVREELFYRRIWDGSLTQQEETGRFSGLRNSYRKKIYSKKLEPKIETKVTSCLEINYDNVGLKIDDDNDLEKYYFEKFKKYFVLKEDEPKEVIKEIEVIKEVIKEVEVQVPIPKSEYEKELNIYSQLSPRDKEIREEKYLLRQILNVLLMINEKIK